MDTKRVLLADLKTDHAPMLAKAVEAARQWASEKIAGNSGISLVLVSGPVLDAAGNADPQRSGYGCGKTHIATAIQWASYYTVDDMGPVAPLGRFYAAADLLALLGVGNRVSELIGYDPPPPVVVVDDVGAEGVLEYVSAGNQQSEREARYYRFMEHCYREKIAVVITANMSLQDLAAHIGGRAWSRLMQKAPRGFMLDLTGVPDWRRYESGR